MSLLVKPNNAHRMTVVTPQTAGWQYIGFTAQRLAIGEKAHWQFSDREMCLVILSGIVTVTVEGQTWSKIGERLSIFEDKAPYAVYVPPNQELTIVADSEAEIACCHAPAVGQWEARLIIPNDIHHSVRGQGSNIRYVRDILPQTALAEHLLVVEVRTPGGHSSSYPPHKHDRDNPPVESLLEETYYHRVHPEQGFVFQRVYTDDRTLDESMAVENHDVVLVPKGYHPVVVPHGYESYYLNVMAGPKRVWHFYNDPQHEWLLS